MYRYLSSRILWTLPGSRAAALSVSSSRNCSNGSHGAGGPHRKPDRHEHTPDYYTTLGVHRDADLKTIKMAYFNLAKKFHPDTNATKHARFMFEFIAEAYSVLSDERKRDNYDKYGATGNIYGGMAGGPPRPSGHQTYDSEELFIKLFGEATGRNAESEFQSEHEYNAECVDGHDATRELVINLSFEDAARGAAIEVDLNLRLICIKCQGTRSELGYQSNICPYCEGTGVETEEVGHVRTRRTCSYCEGTKMFNRFKCTECAGTGQMIKAIHNYKVQIPPGCEDGQLLKVPIDEELLACTVAHHKHFYIRINVAESSDFKGRDGFDVYSESDVSAAQALLGGVLHKVGLQSETLLLPLPAGGLEASHVTLVAKGDGIFISQGSGYGDHFVEVGIKVPEELSPQQKETLLKIFREERLENGLVENGVETDDSHRYRTGVIEPAEIVRNFNRTQRS